jgi:hypothetical protein
MASPERQHAYRLLSDSGLRVEKVICVDVDSVLYVDAFGEARTAWLCPRPNGGLIVRDQHGFAAEPPTVVTARAIVAGTIGRVGQSA